MPDTPQREDYESAITNILDHSLQGHQDFEPSIRYLLIKYLTTIATAAASTWLYIEPAIQFADGDETVEALQLTGNIGSAFFVTYNIGTLFFESYFENSLHKDPRFSKLELAHNSKTKIAMIVSVAAISSLPLTALVFAYSPNKPKWLIILKAVVTQLANTLNHTLPSGIIIDVPLIKYITLAPLAPIIIPALLIREYRLSRHERYMNLLAEEKAAGQQRLKDALCSTIFDACLTIKKESIKAEAKRLKFNIDVPADIHAGIESAPKTLQMIANLAPNKTTSNSSWGRRINRGVSQFVGLAGGALVASGISGFIHGMYNQLEDWTGSDAGAISTGILPAYVTLLLTGYFGRQTYKNIYDYLTGEKSDPPTAAQLYPKSFLAMTLIGAFFAAFSSGPAKQFVVDSFDEEVWHGLKDYFENTALYGVAVYSFANIFQAALNQTMKYALNFGGDDTKMLAKLLTGLQRFASNIQRAPGDVIQQSLQDMPFLLRRALLRMTDNEFEKLCKHETRLNLKANNGKIGTWCGFFTAEKNTRRENLATPTASSLPPLRFGAQPHEQA